MKVVLALLLFTASAWGMKDATGVRVIPRDARRIVVLAPSIAEVVAEVLGPAARKWVVGITDYADFPATIQKAERVGSYARFSVEKVVSLRPDLVLATTDGNPQDRVLRIRNHAIPVVVVRTQSFEQIEESYRMIAFALNRNMKGAHLTERLRQGLKGSLGRFSKNKNKRVILQVGDDPLVVAGRESFLNGVLQHLGLVNVYGNLARRYPRPSREDVIRQSPDHIVILALGGVPTDADQMAERWKSYAQLKGTRVSILRDDGILRPSLRILDGIEKLSQTLR